MQQPFMAYENDADGFTTGELQIKNALDVITIEGTLEITKDRQGRDDILIVW